MLKQVTVYPETPRGKNDKPFPGLVNTDKIVWGRVARMSGVDVPLVMLVLESTDKDRMTLIVEGVPEDFMERVWVSGWNPAEYNGDAPFNNSARVVYGTAKP